MEWCIKLSVFVLSVLALSSADMCKDSPNPLSCHGARVVREALRQLAPVEGADVMRLADGIEVVEIAPASARANGARSLPQDDTLLGRLARYLESHELKIRLNNLMPSPQFRELLAATYKDLEQDKTIGGQNFDLLFLVINTCTPNERPRSTQSNKATIEQEQ